MSLNQFLKDKCREYKFLNRDYSIFVNNFNLPNRFIDCINKSN